MAFKSFILLSVVATALADFPGYSPPPPPPPPPPGPPSYYAPPVPAPPPPPPAQYSFEWAVKDDASGNDFNQKETRDGDLTEGSYSVLLSDGRIQTVTYHVNGDSGLIAEVTYEGEMFSLPYRKETTTRYDSLHNASGFAHGYGGWKPPESLTTSAPKEEHLLLWR
ncbi:uncharacterized protein LOC143036207 [Oratosquilla oratoria]|uniref:uncharacterized protein LOC143036207 n=1 Tax=Oratosquilla oratoria TaxID=337810 RepID=UPI003F7622B2